MWVKQCHKPSPSHHNFYRWYGYHFQSWVVDGAVSSHIWWPSSWVGDSMVLECLVIRDTSRNRSITSWVVSKATFCSICMVTPKPRDWKTMDRNSRNETSKIWIDISEITIFDIFFVCHTISSRIRASHALFGSSLQGVAPNANISASSPSVWGPQRTAKFRRQGWC